MKIMKVTAGWLLALVLMVGAPLVAVSASAAPVQGPAQANVSRDDEGGDDENERGDDGGDDEDEGAAPAGGVDTGGRALATGR